MAKIGDKIRCCRQGKATYIFVKSDTPDKGYCYGPCIDCVCNVGIDYNLRHQVSTYHPVLCNLCDPRDGQRGHWQLYSTGRLSREKIVYKPKEQCETLPKE